MVIRFLNIVRLFLVVCLLIFTGLTIKAEEYPVDSAFYAIEARYHHGIVIPHHTSMAYLINDYSRGGEFNLIRRRYQSGIWESYIGYPETGIGFWFSTFGEPDIYGEGMAVYPFINFNLFSAGNLTARYRVALGFGYATKPFEVGKNTYNTVFGSHFNAYIGLGVLLTYPLTDRWSLSSTLSLNHMSNGSTRKPNNGINTTTLSLGAIYDFSTQSRPVVTNNPVPKSTARDFIITASAGRNQPAPYNTDRHWSGSITIAHLWHRTKIRSYGIGLDFLHYGGAPLAFINFEDLDEYTKYSFSDYFYTGIYGTMESNLGSTTLYVATGAYLHYKTKPKQPLYARLGIKQQISEKLLGHFGIKANFFTAEFIEFGLGYKLRYRE